MPVNSTSLALYLLSVSSTCICLVWRMCGLWVTRQIRRWTEDIAADLLPAGVLCQVAQLLLNEHEFSLSLTCMCKITEMEISEMKATGIASVRSVVKRYLAGLVLVLREGGEVLSEGTHEDHRHEAHEEYNHHERVEDGEPVDLLCG